MKHPLRRPLMSRKYTSTQMFHSALQPSLEMTVVCSFSFRFARSGRKKKRDIMWERVIENMDFLEKVHYFTGPITSHVLVCWWNFTEHSFHWTKTVRRCSLHRVYCFFIHFFSTGPKFRCLLWNVNTWNGPYSLCHGHVSNQKKLWALMHYISIANLAWYQYYKLRHKLSGFEVLKGDKYERHVFPC
jgi:hypothetical protein